MSNNSTVYKLLFLYSFMIIMFSQDVFRYFIDKYNLIIFYLTSMNTVLHSLNPTSSFNIKVMTNKFPHQ